MSMENAIPFEELERRRKKSIASRKLSVVPPHNEHESAAMAVINEIFNPSLKIPETVGHYTLPAAVRADDLEALKDLDVRKLAELKEVFLLFDTDCDGLLSKDDLRFTFLALGGEAPDELLEEMLKEAKEPLDYDAFVELMSHRTIELDPEDVLLEAWSKWDDYGTGKIDEKRCADYIEIFPYLRESVIENSTSPEYVFCNSREQHYVANSTATSNVPPSLDDLLAPNAFIYSAAKVLGIRVRFRKPIAENDLDSLIFNIAAAYRFLKKDNFRNDGRLIEGSYCDYYFFANADGDAFQTPHTWLYFHSPRFPAKYPAHIKCSYKFIGRPESRVEIIFEELNIPHQPQGCNLDKLTVFDSESANMNAVIDVLCDALPARRIISSGPDLLIEFNASSNVTAKGFRGKFRFPQSAEALQVPGNANDKESSAAAETATNATTKQPTVVALEKLSVRKPTTSSVMSFLDSKKKFATNENCKHIFDSRNNKSGIFDTSSVFTVIMPNVNIIPVSNTLLGRIQCRYEFNGEPFERIQIKFLDFNIPSEQKNLSNCKLTESLQLLAQQHGKYECAEAYCGSFLPKPILSKDNKLQLQFVGKYPAPGAKASYYGFKAEYKFITNFGVSTGEQQDNQCSFIYNSTIKKSGWFSSPNFPGFYPQNLVCSYFFHGALEEQVLIRFTYFDVEGIGTCEFQTASDYVEFSNFLSTDRKFARICGKREKFEVRSDGRYFRVTFYSNDRFDKTGFRASYDFESKNTPEEITSVQSFVSNDVKHLYPESLLSFQNIIICIHILLLMKSLML